MITKETIERFFNNKCTPQESVEVSAYLEQNPDALNDIEQEWNEFQNPENLSPLITKKLWQEVQSKSNRTPIVKIYLKRFAVAASLILMLGTVWYFLINKKDSNQNAIVEVKNNLKTVNNTTASKITVWLSDSSIAELMPNSSITFTEQFDSLRRNVTLKGEAFFSITKDPSRPFSVTSDSIITTVLGTKFTIKAYKHDKQIKVLLHEGRVMITPNGITFKGNKPAYYLFPGDVFVYTKNTSVAVIQNNTGNNLTTKDASSFDKDKAVMQSDNWYMFNNQPLYEVFKQLEILYNTKIEYNNADLKGFMFIGKLDKSDSLETILNSIALLNNLHIKKHGNSYFISK